MDAWSAATILPQFGRNPGITHPRRGPSLVGKRDRSRAVGEAMDGVAVVAEGGEVDPQRLGAVVAVAVVATGGVAAE